MLESFNNLLFIYNIAVRIMLRKHQKNQSVLYFVQDSTSRIEILKVIYYKT
jgi:hypothetical protein